MKHIKSYENLNKETPYIGDYIQILIIDSDFNESDVILNNFIDFVNNNVGQIKMIYNNGEVRIKYDNVPSTIRSWFDKNKSEYSKITDINQVDDYIIGKTKEEVKIKMISNKYNL